MCLCQAGTELQNSLHNYHRHMLLDEITAESQCLMALLISQITSRFPQNLFKHISTWIIF
uniref:Uncharacterized protein n=1 Tax=Arundo donax TaxID=35708 RepID=A0A0A9HQU6_ARUDO